MALTVTSNRGAINLTSPGNNPLTINSGVTVSGGNYAVYASIDQSWTITNFGTLLGKYGVYLNDANSAPGSALTNSGTAALISGTKLGVEVLGSYSTVTNQGRIIGGSGDGVDLDAKSDAVSNSGTTALIQGSKNGIYAGPSAAVITNLGTIAGVSGDGVSLKGGGTVTNSTISAHIVGGTDGVYATTASAVVINAGTIIGTSGSGVYLKSGGRVTNSSTVALISGGGNYGVRVNGGTGIVTNQGTMTGAVAGVDFLDGGTVANTGTAARILGGDWGGYFLGGAVTVTNQGTIWGTLDNGVNIGDGGALTNSGTGAVIYGAGYGIDAFGNPLTILNQGLISGHSGSGVYLGAGGTVTNSAGAQIDGATYGVLAGTTTIGVVNQGSIVGATKVGVYLRDGGTVSNNGTGAFISGDFGIKVKGGAGTVTNQGSAVGATNAGVYLGDGGTVTNSTTGQLDGHVNGVVGFNAAIGVLNQGSIAGTTKAGVYLGSGGTVTNSGTAARIAGALFGVDVHSGPATIIDQGTLSGATASVQFAGASGNLLELYPGAKLVGVANGVSGIALLALASGASAGAISGIGSQYIGFGALDVEGGALWTMSGSNTVAASATLSVGASATLTVSGSLVLLGNPTLEGSGTIATSGTGAIEVGIGGLAAAGQFLIDGGRTVVTDGAVSLGDVLNEGTVTGLASYGIYLGAGGRVSNSRVGRISGQDDGIAAKGAATVGNQGTITGASTYGVDLGAGGSVTNSGTGALISGYDAGVFSNLGPATVLNGGRITTTAGESGAAVNLKDGGTVTNQSSGTISSGSLDGVYIFGGVGTVVNAGQISAGFRGVYLGTGGTVTNQGSLSGSNYGIEIRNGIAVVTNSGTITSEFGKAVGFAANYANTLAIIPGAVFHGVVDGGNPVGGGEVSTLELKTGASAGTLAGLGSEYVNFALTTIDSGASWTLTGYNSLASGATLTNSGALKLSDATLTGNGVLVNNGGVTLDPSTLTVASLLGTGVVTVDAGSMLDAQGTIAGGETIAFAGDNAELHLDTPDNVSGSVTNVGLGDLIDLQGIAPGSVQFSAGTLSFSGGSFALSLNGTPAVQAVASADGTLFEVVGPVIAGTTADQPVTDATTVDPFSGVAVTDANAGQTETVTVTLSDAANGTLSNLGTGNFSDGVYTDTGTADQVTTALDSLVFTPAVDTGPLGHQITTTFTIQATDTAGALATDSTTSVVATAVPTLLTLATFNGTLNGADPLGGLVADSSGDLLGTTSKGGADSDGTVFEITKSGGVFASTPATVVTFDGGNGASPQAGLITDATGDLLGTTAGGGANGAGTVFEIASSSGVYSNSPTTLATFSDSNNIGYRPVAGVLADGAGDLFGTVRFPAGANDGAVFEIANGTTTVTQVVGFTGGDDGGQPEGALIADAAGDLFGTTNIGGTGGQGTVFEIAKTGPNTYASTPTTLVNFTSGNGANPLGGLVTDANGDLFGTTSSGADGYGTVFEIAKTGPNTYATTATTLVTFTGSGNGANPADTLLIDSNGNLFGTTQNGGAGGDGTVFELAKTQTGYASTPTTLVTFNGTGNGANPYAGLLADPAGDLFGTTQNGGADGDGTVFEVVSTGANFDPVIAGTTANQAVTDATTIDPFSAVTITDPKSGQTETVTVTLSNAANGTLENLDGGNFSDGVYTVTGTAAQVTTALDGLVFQPTDHQVPPGQTVTTTFTIQDTDTFGATATDSTTSVVATAVAVPIAIIGTEADQTVTDRSTINPFLNVLISDPNAGQTETVTLTQSDTANGTLSNLGGFTPTGTPGVYTDSNTAAQVTTDLQGLVFTPTFYPGVVGETATTSFTIADTDTAGENATDSTTSVIATAVPVLTTLVTFDSSGENPQAGLIADRAGDLFGTTESGAGASYGTVFEIARTGVGTYATTPTTLVTFAPTGTHGADPYSGLIADAAGDLFGTTANGGDADSDGTVFEVAKTATGYATTETTLIAFNGAGDGSTPYAGLIDDAAGDLFGTTYNYGPGGHGTVFEIAKTESGYASTPMTLVTFNGGDGANPSDGLVADAAGDLFGATNIGAGTVFEIAKTATGYATTPTTLVTFAGNGSEGSDPLGTLITDANGDLFGTTFQDGPDGGGTVFEIANTATGYNSTPITLVSFNGSNGSSPQAGLIADAAGDLFGTTIGGGADGDGTVFEIANTATGYATTPITLATFDGTGNGANPFGGLIADSAGDLFGTTEKGGATGDGTAFELTDTGLTFAPVISGTQAGQLVTDAATVDPFAGVTITDGNSGQTETVTVTLSNPLNGTLTDLGNGSYAAGIFSDTGTAAQVTGDLDCLVFTPTAQQVPIGQTVTTTFTLDDVNTANAVATDTSTSVIATAAAPLTTLFTFNGTLNGADPVGGLLADANGDLFGMTVRGGANTDGTVFELANSDGTYAATPTTLVTFAGSTNGKSPAGGLIADAAGDLFGETQAGGASGDGTVFEIVNNTTSYATSPTTLATFTGIANGATLFGGLIADAAGDLFGTTSKGGADNDGTVFEIVNTKTGYASPTTLITFDGTGNGATPKAGLLADPAGDLFGTTNAGGADGDGTVFEIANTLTGYATTPTTLATFTGADTGAQPFGNLITDAAGDLFGVTQTGGADGDGTVFELQNTATGYAATPITLLTFNGAGDGATPGANLIADAAGDLFGTTESGGADSDGTVFELAKTATGYAVAPATLVTFTGTANGSDPRADLLADAAGDLFGTTQNGGADNDGTLFELTDTGLTFAPVITGTEAGQAVTGRTTLNPFSRVTITDGNSGQTETLTVTLSHSANGTLSNLAAGSFQSGVYSDTGTAAEVTEALRGLVFTPTDGQVAAGQTVTTGFTIVDTDTATVSATDSTTTVVTTDTGPRTLTWTGAANTTFTNAANWDDTTFGHNPALWAENATDTVAFDSGGGVISGTGTAAAISFGGDGAWELATGTELTTPGSVTVGDTQRGELLIDAGASLIGTGTGRAVIANTAGASGSSANVSGAGSDWRVNGSLVVGDAGFGSLSLSQGGSASAGALTLGAAAGSDGVVSVAGTGTALTLTGDATIGNAAAGELSILAGASVSAAGLTIGTANAASSGNVDVEGAGSTLFIDTGGFLNIGVAGGGSGVLTIGAGTTLHFAGTVVENGHASYNNNGGVIDPDAIEFTTPDNSGNGLNEYSLYVGNINAVQISAGEGVWDTPMVLTGTSVADAQNNIDNNSDVGEWQLGQGGTMVLNTNTIDVGQAIVFEDATDTLVIGQLVNGGSAGVSGVDPTVAPGAENVFQAGGFEAQIWGYQVGDRILFDNMFVASDTIVGGNTLEVFISGDATPEFLTFFNKTGNRALGVAGMEAAAAEIAADNAPCFAAGTRIATERGEVEVEGIGVGERVRVLLGGGVVGDGVVGEKWAEVIWVGRREVDCSAAAAPKKVWPVRVAAGAFGPGCPHADVWLSPDHAVYVSEVLIPVKYLVNGTTIAQVPRDRVVYHHLELAQHNVMLAQGLPAESFLDMKDGSNYSNRPGPVRLYPDFTVRMWEAFGCARLVVTGPELLAARALVEGFVRTQAAA